VSNLIPVNVLTGFLGSGKTTLLNRLLSDPAFANCAVLINELGAIAIDHHLVSAIDGDVTVLSSGCVCCTVRSDLSTAMRALFDQRERGEIPLFTRMIVETTGLADPVPVVATLMHDPVLRHHFRTGNVLTTIDAVNGQGNLERYPECLKQAALADRLVLTKLDLAEHDRVETLLERLRQVNPVATIIHAGPACVDAQVLLGDDLFEVETKSREVTRWLEAVRQPRYLAPRSLRAAAAETVEAGAHRDIRAFALILPDAIDWTVFSIWLSLLLHTHGDKVLRVKGLLNVAGADTPVVIHGVQQLVHPPTHLDRWPDEDERSRLVFIVQGLDPKAIEASLAAYQQAYSA
jgi:G3E family GTPase